MALKSTRYRKVAPAALNRRSVPRHPVKISGAALTRECTSPIEATLLDISIYGCRVEADAVFQEGETVQIAVDGHDPVDATLIWQKAKQAGCRFAQAINSDVLRSLTLTA